MCAVSGSATSSRKRERPDRIRASSRRRTDRPSVLAAPTAGEVNCLLVKLRLYHHPDGARIAYREAGTGPPLALLHSAGLTHREWEPVVDEIAHRYRVVMPDLPLHGDSEDRPRHPYTPEWLTALLAGFLAERAGRARWSPGTGSARCWHCGPSRASSCVRRSSCCCRTRCTPSPPPGRSRRRAACSCAPRWCPGATACSPAPGGVILRPSRGDRLTVTGADGVRDRPSRVHGPRRRSCALLGQGHAPLAATSAGRPARGLRRDGVPGAPPVGRRRRRAPAGDRR